MIRWFSRCGIRLVGLLALLLLPFNSSATWYQENVASGADIIMMDLRWPWWASDTYYANWNSSFNPKPNNLSFYGGFLASVPDGPGSLPNTNEVMQSGYRPGSVWTFWGSDSAGTPVRFVDVAPNLFIKNDYGGEGSSGTTGGEVWPFIKSRRWYTMLARVWTPAGQSTNAESYIGRWIKDQEAGEWHLIGFARLPISATSFAGNSGFIEPLTSEKAVRPLNRRRGYFRKNDQWLKSDTISIDKTEYVVVNVVPDGAEDFAAIEYSQRPDLLPRTLTGKPLAGDVRHSFTMRQPKIPDLDKPTVENVHAWSGDSEIVVEWDVPAKSSPQLGYKIEMFDNTDCSGDPLIANTTLLPNDRKAKINWGIPIRAVRFTMLDVFDQSSSPVILTNLPKADRFPSVESGQTIPGLAYEIFLTDTKRRTNYFALPTQRPGEEHYWLTLDEMSRGKPGRRGLARGLDLSILEGREEGFAIKYKGFLRVRDSGFHLFHAQVDGAYRVRLDGVDLMMWDGQHGTTEKTAFRNLVSGDHSLEVDYLYDALPAKNFGFEWEGPTHKRQPLSVESLRAPNETAYPKPQISTSAPGDGTGLVDVRVDPHGHAINQTSLYLGRLQIAQSTNGILSFHGPLLKGSNTFWCRVIFDNNRSVDSAPTGMNVTGPPMDPSWTVRNVSDAKSTAGIWPSGTNSVQFFGNGMHTVSRRIKGDFTLTCRIDSYNGSHGEPVNPNAWVGVMAMEHGERLNWEWGQYFYVVQTAAEGLRASADFTDFGATRISSYELPKHRPWLRIVRQGNVWTGWTSADGTTWELNAYQFKRCDEAMDVGLFFSALPQNARAHFYANVSALQIQPGALPESIPPTPIAARNTSGDRLTGVVVSRSNPEIVVTRSAFAGLKQTVDDGLTWTNADGNLTGDDLIVRSVAIHPTDPRIMLRASGIGAKGGLWKTVDGGLFWAKLAFDGDFDGRGPSALCGEVLAFDLRTPETIYAGCESQGFFKSTNGGTSWIRLGLSGERITSVTVWPWESHYPASAQGMTHVCVTTCPDRWMQYLGRGEPAITNSSTRSRSYLSPDGVKTLAISDEREDTGFYNAAHDKALQTTTEMRYGTTQGMQTQISPGSHMALYPLQKNLEWLRPFTAVGATAKGDQKFGRFFAQALDPEVPGRLSRSEIWAFEWSWLQPKGEIPKGGLVAAAGDVKDGRKWWFVFTDGLFFSADGGDHLRRISQ